MKKLPYLCAALTAALLISSSSFATSIVARVRIAIPSKPIQKSIQPLTLYDNTVGALELLFNFNLGQVSLEVCDEAGATVYSDSFQAVGGSAYGIPVADWESGVYTLTVVANGRAYTWEVELVEE